MTPLLVTVAGIHIVALATPGPDFFFVSQTAASKSRAAGYKAALGITLGVLFWAALSLLGLNILLKKAAWLQQMIMVAGGAYLCYLACLLIKSALKHKTTEAEQAVDEQSHAAELDQQAQHTQSDHVFLKGLFTNLANPKAVIYFGSVFSAFVGGVSDNNLKWWILTLIVIESMVWFSIVAAVFSMPKMQRGYQKSAKWIDGFAGALFASFGLHLIYKGAKEYAGYASTSIN